MNTIFNGYIVFPPTESDDKETEKRPLLEQIYEFMNEHLKIGCRIYISTHQTRTSIECTMCCHYRNIPHA